MMPHCGPPMKLVAREEHKVGPGGDSGGGRRLVADMGRPTWPELFPEPMSWIIHIFLS